MKGILKIVLVGMLLFGCSGDSDSPPKNTAPTAPMLVFPANNLLCIDNKLEFEWNASSDKDGDVITYKIDVAEDNQFSNIAFSTSSALTKHTFALKKGQVYYWRVKATDSKNDSSAYSSVFNLFTEGLGFLNHLPFSPELVKPSLYSVVSQGVTKLEWKGSDTDKDPLTYDVYFGTKNPPTNLVSENQNSMTFDVNTANAENYYWKVVVKDDKGGETIGQIWGFSTE